MGSPVLVDPSTVRPTSGSFKGPEVAAGLATTGASSVAAVKPSPSPATARASSGVRVPLAARLVLPRALAPAFLRVTRANRTFVTAAGARRRIRQRSLRPAPYGPPPTLRDDVRVDVAQRGGWPVYSVTRRNGASHGTVVYVHGGGWVGEIVSQHWHLAAQLAAEVGATVVLPIYPLVPFGTAEEARVGVVDLVTTADGPVALAGDSAGGQIVLSAALSLRDAGVVVADTVLIAPALDLTWSNPRIPEVQPTDPWLGTPGGRVLAEHWRGSLDLRHPTVSPLFGDLAGLGRVTVFTGTRDVLNPDAHLLRDRAERAGVDLEWHEGEGDVHAYPLLPTRSGREARAALVRTLRRSFGR
ncbi:acetyl esterase/lipase [Frigoribacterium sp. PvP054]|uniref:alpha/beta hydrolase n=1 Tax=Frigoribacterium sp. PvP054 TaxID=3156438 RepID=UPI00339290F6